MNLPAYPKFFNQMPQTQRDWDVVFRWLTDLAALNQAAAVSGQGSAAAAQAAANAAQVSANAAQTSANTAQTAAGAAQTTANTGLTTATGAAAAIVILQGQMTTVLGLLTPGQSVTLTLAKITPGGANGSVTFTGGIETAHVDPT